ncbi:Sodium/calcium exchanger protein-domain-containing protein [Lentinula raphanica]|nr:Sodium/calcium exchanger protein-domain-containing protein [Lentinula raphanica]
MTTPPYPTPMNEFGYINHYTSTTASYPEPQFPGPALARMESNYSTMSSDSRVNLVERTDSQPNSARSRKRYTLPLFRGPSETSRGGQNDNCSRDSAPFQWRDMMKGWRLLLLGSWFNVLLCLIPVACIFSITMTEYHGLVFMFCLLSLLPLVKIHELTTRELSARIGGSKTGLLNASLNNTVEVVVAFSALRKCELHVVQSSLIGSILGKLLLVLGLCFFAGGLKFTEQGFDHTANQVHSSLLSISVGVLLLPVAYHFALSGNRNDDVPENQRLSILNMSHAVSVILLTIYGFYLVFQLVSHTHLYRDSQTKSRKLSINVQTPAIFHTMTLREKGRGFPKSESTTAIYNNEDTVSRWFKATQSEQHAPALSPSSSISDSSIKSASPRQQPGTPYISPPNVTGSEVTLTDSAYVHPVVAAVDPSIRLVDFDGMGGSSLRRTHSPSRLASRSASEASEATCSKGSGRTFSGSTINSSNHPGLTVDTADLSSENFTDIPLGGTSKEALASPTGSVKSAREPQLSWFMTVTSLIVVTIAVAFIADWLVEAMDGISETISKEWVALVLLPAVTSIAECGNAIGVSVKDQVTLSISVAVGSSIQTALFVIPLMVTIAWAMGKPLALLFDPFESLVLYISVQTMTHVVADGKSNWLEGAILICLYIMIAVSFWFYPGSNLPSSLAACTSTA